MFVWWIFWYHKMWQPKYAPRCASQGLYTQAKVHTSVDLFGPSHSERSNHQFIISSKLSQDLLKSSPCIRPSPRSAGGRNQSLPPAKTPGVVSPASFHLPLVLFATCQCLKIVSCIYYISQKLYIFQCFIN